VVVVLVEEAAQNLALLVVQLPNLVDIEFTLSQV
jgi:hypothetical protein